LERRRLRRRIYECFAEDVQCDGIQLPPTINWEPDLGRVLSIESANLFNYSGFGVVISKKRIRKRERGKKIRRECN
jgi:hypothetical protein